MSYRIEVSREAKDEILGLPGHIRAQARQLIKELGQNPVPSRAKELQGKPNLYRIWLAGNWRIAYEVDRQFNRIRILRVGEKKHIDYKSL